MSGFTSSASATSLAALKASAEASIIEKKFKDRKTRKDIKRESDSCARSLRERTTLISASETGASCALMLEAIVIYVLACAVVS